MAKKSNLAVVPDQLDQQDRADAIDNIIEISSQPEEQPAKPMHAGGRPKKYNKEQIEQIKQSLEQYIEAEEIPVIAEFAYLNKLERQSLYDYIEFSTLVKRAIDKKEAYLEKQGLKNKVNNAMAIFSLKQLGWRDKEPEAKGDTIINVSLPDSVKKYAK